MTAAEETVVPPAGTSRLGEPAGGGSTMTPHAGQVTVSAELKQGCRFLADFGTAGRPSLLDEPEPLGEGQGPDAPRVICAAAAWTSPLGLTATVLAPGSAPSHLGPPLTRLRLR